MFAEVHCPRVLHADELDQYLERGWFRMGQTIFTTNFLNFKGHFYSAIWLRIPLTGFSLDKTGQKLSKTNARFRVEIQQALITQQKEMLFSAYKKNVPFEASASLSTLLYGKADYNIYNTREINIYDDDKLIATGFFDVGKHSAAGISSFYDPAYKKYSLGKYLIYLKLDYCHKIGLKFFYPGYFVPGYSLFDYKLHIGQQVLQYLEFPSLEWREISTFKRSASPLQVMHEKLHLLSMLLKQSGIDSRILKYEFFDANLIPELEGIVLFDFPIFLSCSGLTEETPIVFDIRDQQYHLIKCKSVWASTGVGNSKDMYASHVFKFDHGVFSTEHPQAVASEIFKELNLERKTEVVRSKVS